MEEPPDLPSNDSLSMMPLGAKLANMFVAPGEVFDDLRRRPPAWPNWAAPLALLVVLGIISAFVVLSQPAILQAIRDSQEKGEAAIRQAVATGQTTQAQANQQISFLEWLTGPSILKAFGILRAIFGSALRLFCGALVLWLVGRFALRAEFGYHRALEVAGLALMIAGLGALVAMLLAVIYGSFNVSASPAMLLKLFDPQNPAHLALAAFDVFTIWRLAVISQGLSRLTGAKVAKAAAWVFGLWLLWTGFGLGLLVLFSKLRPPPR